MVDYSKRDAISNINAIIVDTFLYIQLGMAIMPMEFEWDENKAKSNRVKHGIRFEDAVLVLDDPQRTEPLCAWLNINEGPPLHSMCSMRPN